MKKTKFAVLLTAFMAVLGLSSCLGDPDPYQSTAEIMKVDGFMGFYTFMSAAGYTVNPTNSSSLTSDLTSESGYAYVTYKYDTRTVSSETTSIDAEIQYVMPIKNINFDYSEVEPNAPIHTVDPSVVFYDKTNIFLSMAYYYKDSDDQEELNEELNKHYFYLYQVTSEQDKEADDDTMVLYLSHVISGEAAGDEVERSSKGSDIRHFDLNNVLGGAEPREIIIKFKESSTSSLNSATDSRITINYKSILDQYFNNNTSL